MRDNEWSWLLQVDLSVGQLCLRIISTIIKVCSEFFMNFSLFAALIEMFENNSEMYTTHQREQFNVLVVSLYSNNEPTSTYIMLFRRLFLK